MSDNDLFGKWVTSLRIEPSLAAEPFSYEEGRKRFRAAALLTFEELGLRSLDGQEGSSNWSAEAANGLVVAALSEGFDALSKQDWKSLADVLVFLSSVSVGASIFERLDDTVELLLAGPTQWALLAEPCRVMIAERMRESCEAVDKKATRGRLAVKFCQMQDVKGIGPVASPMDGKVGLVIPLYVASTGFPHLVDATVNAVCEWRGGDNGKLLEQVVENLVVLLLQLMRNHGKLGFYNISGRLRATLITLRLRRSNIVSNSSALVSMVEELEVRLRAEVEDIDIDGLLHSRISHLQSAGVEGDGFLWLERQRFAPRKNKVKSILAELETAEGTAVTEFVCRAGITSEVYMTAAGGVGKDVAIQVMRDYLYVVEKEQIRTIDENTIFQPLVKYRQHQNFPQPLRPVSVLEMSREITDELMASGNNEFRKSLIKDTHDLRPVKAEEWVPPFKAFGYSDRVAPILALQVLDCQSSLYETVPNSVTIEVVISTEGMTGAGRSTWDLQPPGRVMLMAALFPSDKPVEATEEELLAAGDAAEVLGLQKIRTCILLLQLDEAGRPLAGSKTLGFLRTVRLRLSGGSYARDVADGRGDFYGIFTALYSPEGVEFVNRMVSVDRLISGGWNAVPKWIRNTLVGLDPGPVSASEDTPMLDTFVSAEHAQSWAKERGMTLEGEGEIWTINSLKLQARTRVPCDRIDTVPYEPRPLNKILFSNHQVDAIVGALGNGLTLTLGAARTGKRSVVAQQLSILLSEKPSAKVLLLADTTDRVSKVLRSLRAAHPHSLRIGRIDLPGAERNRYKAEIRLNQMLHRRKSILSLIYRLGKEIGNLRRYDGSLEEVEQFRANVWNPLVAGGDIRPLASKVGGGSGFIESMERIFAEAEELRSLEAVIPQKMRIRLLFERQTTVLAATEADLEGVKGLRIPFDSIIVLDASVVLDASILVALEAAGPGLERVHLLGSERKGDRIFSRMLRSRASIKLQYEFNAELAEVRRTTEPPRDAEGS